MDNFDWTLIVHCPGADIEIYYGYGAENMMRAIDLNFFTQSQSLTFWF